MTLQISVRNLTNESQNPPNSPRSLLACKKAGIHPGDLLYKPLSVYQAKQKDERLAKMYYEDNETQRQNDLNSVMSNYNQIQQNGITEAEYIIMGRPEILAQSVRAFEKEHSIDQTKVSRIMQSQVEQIEKTNQHFAKVQQFNDEKNKQRVKKTEEMQMRLEQQKFEQEEQKREQAELLREKQEKYAKERELKEKEMKEHQEQVRREQAQKQQEVDDRLRQFREEEARIFESRRQQNELKRDSAYNQFLQTTSAKQQQILTSQQIQENRLREQQERKARETELRKQLSQQKQEESRQRIERFEREVEAKKAKQAAALNLQQRRAAEAYEANLQRISQRMQESGQIRAERVNNFNKKYKEESELKRTGYFQAQTESVQSYHEYKNTVLFKETLEYEKHKMDQEKRRQQAARQQELAAFKRQEKNIMMQRKTDMLWRQQEELKKQQQELIYVQAKLAAEKQNQEFMNTYRRCEANSSSLNPLISSRSPQRPMSQQFGNSGYV